MQDLLDGLLDLSKLEAGGRRAEFPGASDRANFQAVRAALSVQARAQNLRLRVRPTDLWALTDPALLQRVVMNLGHNALRYTSQGAVLIVCRTVHNGTGVRIEVLDSGRGIDPAHHQQIFQEFYRVDGESADVSKGMGLGLHIVAVRRMCWVLRWRCVRPWAVAPVFLSRCRLPVPVRFKQRRIAL